MKSKSAVMITLVAVLLGICLVPMPCAAKEYKIEVSDADSGDFVGGSVSISGDYAIVGADGDDAKGDGAGAAYIFNIAGSKWIQQTKLTSNDAAAADKFGAAVSISGDYAIAGAPYEDNKDNGANAGAVYFFKREGTSWIQQSKLIPKDGSPSDYFGGSVSISGDYAIVGAAYDDDSGLESGSAYIFKRETYGWTQKAKLTPSDGAQNDYFGVSVDIDGEYAVVGAYLHNDPDFNTSFGAAYIFKRSGESWSQQAKLIATDKDGNNDGAVSDYFGGAVSISGDYVIIGAYGDDDAGRDSGSAYIFKRNASAWNFSQKLTPGSYGEPYDYFAKSLSIYGQYAVIGAEGDDDKGKSAGAAYLFKRGAGDRWELSSKLTASDGAANDLMGKSVGASLSYVIAGAAGRNSNAGLAYIYDSGTSGGVAGSSPIISGLSDQSLQINAQNHPIYFTVTDQDTPASSLSLSATSSNTSLIPSPQSSQFSKAQSGESQISCTLTLTPVANKTGTATITLTARDEKGNADTVSFTIRVSYPAEISGLDPITINENASTGPIEFEVNNAGTAVQDLISVTSSNTDLVPEDDEHIKLECLGTACSLTVIPVPGESGTAEITLVITDGEGSVTTESFTLTVRGAPKIEGLSDKITNEDTPVSASFTLSDENGADNLEVSYGWMSVEMSEGTLIPEGTGGARKLRIIPPPNENGTAYITIAARNSYGAVTREVFKLDVLSVNDKPVIFNLPDTETINQDTTERIAFNVGDADHPLSKLKITAASDNPSLVADQNITAGGTGTDRTLSIKPASGEYGTAKITVTVSDGVDETEDSFDLTVNATPKISLISDQTADEDSSKEISFTVDDPDNDLTELTVSAVADNSGLVPSSGVKFTGSGSIRKLIITPAKDQSGQAEITVTVRDPNNAVAQERFFLTVNEKNDPPIVSKISSQQGKEDTWSDTISFEVSDLEGGQLSVTVTPDSTSLVPADGNHIQLNGTPTFSNYPVYLDPKGSEILSLKLLPAEDQAGATGISVTVKDDGSPAGTTVVRFTFTVGGENDAPLITADIADQITSEDTLSAKIPFKVKDLEGGELTVSVTSNTPSLVPDENITILGVDENNAVVSEPNTEITLNLTIMPEKDQLGTARITVTVSDGIATSKAKSFSFTVNPVNDPPKVYAITPQSTNEDTLTDPPIIIRVSDPEGDALTVTVGSDKADLVPNDDDHININNFGYKDYPVAASQPGDITELELTLLPATNKSGKAKITVTAKDAQLSASTQFFFTVNNTNDPPAVSDIAMQRTNEDTVSANIPFTVTDLEGGELTLSVASDTPSLVKDENITVLGVDAENKVSAEAGKAVSLNLKILPEEDQIGSARITVTADDGEGTSKPVSFVFTVDALNDPPKVYPIGPQTTGEETPTAPITIQVSDPEGGQVEVSVTSENAALVPNDDAHINIEGFGNTYLIDTEAEVPVELELVLLPATDQWGKGKITVSATDGQQSAQTQFILTVNDTNDPPTIAEIPAQTTKEGTAIDVKFTVSDPDGDELEISAVSDNAEAVPNDSDHISINSKGNETTVVTSSDKATDVTIRITPAEHEDGKAGITVIVRDKESAEARKTFLVTVESVNDSPRLFDIPYQVIMEEDTPVPNIVPVAFKVSDPDGGVLEVTASSLNTELVPNDNDHINLGESADNYFGKTLRLVAPPGEEVNLLLRIIPADDEAGIGDMTVTVKDDGNATDAATFILRVDQVNDAPVIADIAPQETDKGKVKEVTITVSDDSTPAGNLTVSASWQFGTIPVKGTASSRTLTITPPEGRTGDYTVTVTAQDSSGLTSEKTFVLTINQINTKPVITGIYDRTTEEDAGAFQFQFTVKDDEGGLMPLTVTSSNTALVPADYAHINIKDGTGVFGPSTYKINMLPEVPSKSLTLVVTPESNQYGETVLTIRVEDKNGSPEYTVTETMVLTVTPKNDPPQISVISNQSTDENAPTDKIPFTIKDVDGGTLNVRVTSSNINVVPEDAEHIKIVDAKNNEFGPVHSLGTSPGAETALSLIITPAAGHGTVQITVTVQDSDGEKASNTFVLTVNDINDPPEVTVSPNPADPVAENTSVDVQVKIRDNEGGGLRIKVFSAQNTQLVPNQYPNINIENKYGPEYIKTVQAGQDTIIPVKITPAANVSGTAKLSVEVDDGSSIVEEEFSITVYAVPDEPTISDITNQTTTMNAATSDIPFSVTDAEGGNLTISVTSSNTELVPNSLAYIDISGFGNTHTVASQAGQKIDLKLKLTPASNKYGTAEITVQAQDPEGGIGKKTFTLTVEPVNTLPTVVSPDNFNLSTDEDQPLEVGFTVKDYEGGALKITVQSSSNTTLVPNDFSHLSISDLSNNEFGTTYNLSLPTEGTGEKSQSLKMKITPAADKFGMAIITMRVEDGTAGTKEASFFLTVRSVNDPPSVSTIFDQLTPEDTPTSEIRFTVSDDETAAADLKVTASWISPASPKGTIVVGGAGENRTLVITPPSNWIGDAEIRVTAEDDRGARKEVSFTLTVEAESDDPWISGIDSPQTTEKNTPLVVDFLVQDADTEPGSLVVTAKSSNTLLVPNSSSNLTLSGGGSTRQLTITPAANEVGSSTITITVRDTELNTAKAEFLLTVTSEGPASFTPTISGISEPKFTDEDTPIAVHFTVDDKDTDLDDLNVTRQSLNTLLVPNANAVLSGSGANRTLTITPAKNQSGEAVIRIDVDDGENSVNDSFTLIVNSVNDPPILNSGQGIASQIIDEETEQVSVNFTVSDVETPTEQLEVSATSSDIGLIPNSNLTLRCSEGDCSEYVLTITPAPDKYGMARITVEVSDDSLAINSTASTYFYVTVEGENNYPGDVDGNGTVNLRDGVMCAKIAAGIFISGINLNADVNGDGRIGIHEMIYIFDALSN